MKITKSKLEQIIKEEVEKVFEMHDATRDEWGVASFGDREKFPEHYYPWMASHWRDQILKYVEERQPPCMKSSTAGTSHSSWPCIPNRPLWRAMARALAAAKIWRPSEEADAVIAAELADWTERELNPVEWGAHRGLKEKKDEKWIQGAEEDIEKRGTEGVCTGDKFGGPTCKPGTKRYNLAKTFRKMAKKRKKK